MDFTALADPVAAGIVVGGTALATGLRAGWHDCAQTMRQSARLFARPFNATRIQAELARQVRDIKADGLLRADLHAFGDREFDDATAAMIEARSVDALVARHEQHAARRTAAARTASTTLAQAAELAPVFGLAGTLTSLSQLPSDGLAAGEFAGVISMAVLTTLYGLLLANLACAPVARLIERRSQREEARRQELVNWMVANVAPYQPSRAPARVVPEAEAA